MVLFTIKISWNGLFSCLAVLYPCASDSHLLYNYYFYCELKILQKLLKQQKKQWFTSRKEGKIQIFPRIKIKIAHSELKEDTNFLLKWYSTFAHADLGKLKYCSVSCNLNSKVLQNQFQARTFSRIFTRRQGGWVIPTSFGSVQEILLCHAAIESLLMAGLWFRYLPPHVKVELP